MYRGLAGFFDRCIVGIIEISISIKFIFMYKLFEGVHCIVHLVVYSVHPLYIGGCVHKYT